MIQPVTIQDLLPSEATFVAAIQQLGFGRFEYLQIRNGELLLNPWPVAVRDVKFGTPANTGSRPVWAKMCSGLPGPRSSRPSNCSPRTTTPSA